MRRFYSQNLRDLSDNEAHHLKVLRKEVGDVIEVIDGRGALAKARLMSRSRVEVLSQTHTPLPQPKVILATAITKSTKLDVVLEKGTELGCSSFWLFAGEQGEKVDVKPNHLARLEKITISAMKQSMRLYLPSIEIKKPLKLWDKPSGQCLYGAFEGGGIPHPAKEDTLILIGPEKGFSPDELSLLKEWSATGVRLNTNVLRTETASIASLALLLSID